MKKGVLVVDDNAINQMVISDLLAEFGIDCVRAASGEEAVDLVLLVLGGLLQESAGGSRNLVWR